MEHIQIKKRTHAPFSKECLEEACNLRGTFLKETLLREDLERQIQKLKTEVVDYQQMVELLLSGIRSSIQPDHASLRILAERLVRNDNVSSLHYTIREGVIYLWILEKKENFDSELSITRELSKLFSDFCDLRFDFIILPLEDLKAEGILPPNAKEVFSR